MAKDDAAWAKLNSRTAESVEEKLKRKAEIYDKLQKGKTGGLTSTQLDNLLVDVRESPAFFLRLMIRKLPSLIASISMKAARTIRMKIVARMTGIETR